MRFEANRLIALLPGQSVCHTARGKRRIPVSHEKAVRMTGHAECLRIFPLFKTQIHPLRSLFHRIFFPECGQNRMELRRRVFAVPDQTHLIFFLILIITIQNALESGVSFC